MLHKTGCKPYKSTEIDDFSDMTCSENPGPVFAEVCEAPQAHCSGAKCLMIHRLDMMPNSLVLMPRVVHGMNHPGHEH